MHPRQIVVTLMFIHFVYNKTSCIEINLQSTEHNYYWIVIVNVTHLYTCYYWIVIVNVTHLYTCYYWIVIVNVTHLYTCIKKHKQTSGWVVFTIIIEWRQLIINQRLSSSICSFFAKHASLRSKSKDWLAQCVRVEQIVYP
jgi:hypothetical protein